MKISRAAAWGIVVTDTIIVLLLVQYLFDFAFRNLGLLCLQFVVVVLVLWKSLTVARLDREEKSLTNWQAVKIGIVAGLGPVVLAFLSTLILYNAESGVMIVAIFLVVEMPICILGALIGKKLKDTPEATWRSAIVSSILAFIIAAFISLFLAISGG